MRMACGNTCEITEMMDNIQQQQTIFEQATAITRSQANTANFE